MKSKKGLVFGVVLLALSGCGKNHYEYSVGQKGDQGEPGTDATPVTVVKLCPGVTTYPSKFVEIAFCIDGTLYGTYSANGGFSTEMPPGTYGSNGINASCNFVVLPGCEIQN